MKKILLPAVSILLLSMSGAGVAQNRPVAPLPSSEQPGARELKDALRRIAANRRNTNALIDAGNASLTLGDASAAFNFFRRAESIQPSDGRVKAGIGAALVRQENPFEALQYFDAAARMGVSQRMMALDRGLAFDLLGNFERAQQDYAMAATWKNSDLLKTRHAISLSLSGKSKESDALLVPLLNKNDPAAWRARAFLLAARGKYRESREVARGFLDVNSAKRVEPFLRRMPDLTVAQQAAAVHLGHFPARNIGRDNPNIKLAANNLPSAVPVGGSDRLIPSGKQLGSTVAPQIAAPSFAQQIISEAVVASNTLKVPKPVLFQPAKAPTVQTAAPVAIASTAPPAQTILPKKILSAPVERIETLPVARPAPAIAKPTTIVETKPANVAQNVAGFESLTPAVSSAPVAPTKIPVATPNIPAAPAPIATSIAAPAKVAATAKPVLPAPVFAPAPAPAPVSLPPVATQAAPLAVKQPSIAAPVAKAAPLPAVAPAAPKLILPAPQKLAPPPVQSAAKAAPPAQTSAPSGSGKFDLDQVVQSIDIPDQEKQSNVQTVDLNNLPPKPVVQAKPKPKPAAPNPNISTTPRYWVQIATGPTSSHRGEYRRLSRKYSDLFDEQEGWSSPFKNTARLVVGPFSGYTAAKEWYEALKEAGGDGFVWNSAQGTEVTRLNKK